MNIDYAKLVQVLHDAETTGDRRKKRGFDSKFDRFYRERVQNKGRADGIPMLTEEDVAAGYEYLKSGTTRGIEDAYQWSKARMDRTMIAARLIEELVLIMSHKRSYMPQEFFPLLGEAIKACWMNGWQVPGEEEIQNIAVLLRNAQVISTGHQGVTISREAWDRAIQWA